LGRLAYTVPSVAQLAGSIDKVSNHYIANNDAALKFEVRVANTVEATESSCPLGSESKCYVHYNLEYTPLVHDVIPNQLYWDQEIDIMVNP